MCPRDPRAAERVAPRLRLGGSVKRAAVVAAACALVVSTAGVASAKSTAPPSTAPTTTASGGAGGGWGAEGATATSIKVAGLGDAALYGGADVGARARFQRANDGGGVNGRTIDYLGSSDDGGDPAAGSTAVENSVEH